MRTSRVLLTLVVLNAVGTTQGNWVTLDYPEATDTFALGVHGKNVVGLYSGSLGRRHGYLYDGTTWPTACAGIHLPILSISLNATRLNQCSDGSLDMIRQMWPSFCYLSQVLGHILRWIRDRF